MTKQTSQILFICSGTLLIIGSVAKLFSVNIAPYLFSVGAAGLILLHFLNAREKMDAEMRQKRVARLGFITSLFLALAAYSMFAGTTLWVVAVLIYALSSFYYSFRTE